MEQKSPHLFYTNFPGGKVEQDENEFDAIEREINIDKSSIIRCCKGKQSTAGGYKWKYKEDCLA